MVIATENSCVVSVIQNVCYSSSYPLPGCVYATFYPSCRGPSRSPYLSHPVSRASTIELAGVTQNKIGVRDSTDNGIGVPAQFYVKKNRDKYRKSSRALTVQHMFHRNPAITDTVRALQNATMIEENGIKPFQMTPIRGHTNRMKSLKRTSLSHSNRKRFKLPITIHSYLIYYYDLICPPVNQSRLN